MVDFDPRSITFDNLRPLPGPTWVDIVYAHRHKLKNDLGLRITQDINTKWELDKVDGASCESLSSEGIKVPTTANNVQALLRAEVLLGRLEF